MLHSIVEPMNSTIVVGSLLQLRWLIGGRTCATHSLAIYFLFLTWHRVRSCQHICLLCSTGTRNYHRQHHHHHHRALSLTAIQAISACAWRKLSSPVVIDPALFTQLGKLRHCIVQVLLINLRHATITSTRPNTNIGYVLWTRA